MMLIEVNKQHYEFYNEWRDITLNKAIEWAQTEQPECLSELIHIALSKGHAAYFNATKELTPEQKNKTIPTYIGVMLKAFTSMPDDVIEKLGAKQRTEFFHDFLIDKLFDVALMGRGLQMQAIKQFTFKGKTYHLPKVGKMVNGESLGIDLTAIEFAESSDIMTQSEELQGGNIEALPYLLALLCKEEGEEYNEQKVIEKAETFKDLDMQTVWEVYFFMLKCLIALQSATVDCLSQQALTLRQNLQQKKAALIKLDGMGK